MVYSGVSVEQVSLRRCSWLCWRVMFHGVKGRSCCSSVWAQNNSIRNSESPNCFKDFSAVADHVGRRKCLYVYVRMVGLTHITSRTLVSKPQFC